MVKDINPSRITLRVRLSQPRLALRDTALTVSSRVCEHLASPAVRPDLKESASRFSLVAQHPPLAAWLEEVLGPEGRGLVSASVEYVEGNDVILKLDLADPNGLRSVLRAEAFADQKNLNDVWFIRAFLWVLTRLGGKDYTRAVTSGIDARDAHQRECQTHAMMRMQCFIAVATEIDRAFSDSRPRSWIMCPDSPEPAMELPGHRLREDATQVIHTSVGM